MKHTRTLKTILTIATVYRVFRFLVIYPLMASNPVTTFMLMATPYDIGLLKRTVGGEGKQMTNERQK